MNSSTQGARCGAVPRRSWLSCLGVILVLDSVGCGEGCGGAVVYVGATPSDAMANGSDAGHDALRDGSPLVEAGNDTASGTDSAVADVTFESDTVCAPQNTGAMEGSSAASAGFQGSDSTYYTLYDVACQAPSDCVNACTSAGGTMDSCTAGSECIAQLLDAGPNQCLPPNYWLSVSGAVAGMSATPAELVLAQTEYHDALVVTGFGLSVPDDATVIGVQFDVQRSALLGMGIDSSVRAVQGGATVGAEHALATTWPTTFTDATYGGPNDLWAVSWLPADVRSGGFGLSIAAAYTGTSGNERARVDSVRATVFYTRRCD